MKNSGVLTCPVVGPKFKNSKNKRTFLPHLQEEKHNPATHLLPLLCPLHCQK
jgi:hypothetical protein